MNVIKLTDSRLVQNQVQYEAEPNTFHYLVVIPISIASSAASYFKDAKPPKYAHELLGKQYLRSA